MRPIYLISKTPYPGVIHLPVLSIRFLHPSIDFSRYDGVIVTSKQGIEALKDYTINWEKIQCLCVSEATAEYARKSGVRRIGIASGYGESIPDFLMDKEHSLKWLYVRPEKVASEWVDTARLSGLHIDEAIVYETACNPDLDYEKIDKNGVLIFTSPSTIECFSKKEEILSTHDVVVIGKTTQNALPKGIIGHVSEEQSVASAVDLARKIAMNDKNSSPF